MNSFICVTWCIQIYDMTHSYVCHDSFTCVAWCTRRLFKLTSLMCNNSHSYVCYVSFWCVMSLIHMCDTLIHVCRRPRCVRSRCRQRQQRSLCGKPRRAAGMHCVKYLNHIFFWFVYIGLHVSTCWRRLIGSPKMQIIFHKRATKYMSLLRKMSYLDKGS